MRLRTLFMFHAAGALVKLIWLAIIVLVVIWLTGLVRGRSHDLLSAPS